ncbi:porin [Aeromonas sp. 600479]|uniref:porin n=1 Tax=Aeromonas sp. 600479 TaxID=2712028 RepID=UPI003BA31FEB
MKKSALTMAITSLVLASGAQAATVINQNGTKLDIGGRVNGEYYASGNKDLRGDSSYFRLHVNGETAINNELNAFGFAEYNLPTSGSDNDELRYAYAGMKHDTFGTLVYGRQDGLFDKAVKNTTDIMPEFGGDGLGKVNDLFGTGRSNGLLQYIYTYDGLSLGAQFTGEGKAQNNDRFTNSGNHLMGTGNGFATSATYNFDNGLGLGVAYNQAKKTNDQRNYSSFGGDHDAKLVGGAISYTNSGFYMAVNYSHGEYQSIVNNGFAAESNGYEAVAKYRAGDFEPIAAYIREDVKDTSNNISGRLNEYIDLSVRYYFTENFTTFVDYKMNLLDDGSMSGYSKYGQPTDDIVAISMEYNF